MSFSNSILAKLSQFYMNRTSTYGENYYLMNHIRHINSYYGFIIQLYYRYVAAYAMASPAALEKNSTILDVGCGTGILVKQFSHLGFQACGVDVQPEAIRHSVVPDHCILTDSTALLDYPEGCFDLIVSREVLEHISQDEIDACINEWDRVGKGIMVHIIAVQERGPSATDDPTHVNVQSERWWIDRFETHGYRAVKKPRKLFFSPFGNSGYFMFVKNNRRD